MSFDLSALLRRNIRELKAYSSARDEYSGHSGIFLDANENSLGTPGGRFYHRYPDPGQARLKSAIAGIKGLASEQIFLGNGSDEAIDLLIRAFCEPGKDSIAVLAPTYGMYAVAAAVQDAGVEVIALAENFQPDAATLASVASSSSKLLFICSPNNPSGNLISRPAVETMLKSFQGITVIDEAYIDFAEDPGWADRLSEYPSLVILQTFSKAWGLANVRLGMAYADPEIIRILSRIKYPYNVNGLTQHLVLETLERRDLMLKNVETLKREREKLARSLSEYRFVRKIYPSDANFLLLQVDDADAVYEFLMQQQIIVRNRSGQLHCDSCLRITVGTEEENQAVLDILDGY